MATCRQTITTALRKLRILSEGKRVPAPTEAIDGLAVLQALYVQMFAEAKFGGWTEKIAEADYEAKEFERVLAGGHAITTPMTVVDRNTGLERPPLDLAAIMVVDSGEAAQLYLYDAFVADWARCDGLTLDSVAPLSLRNPDGLACWLAVAYGDEFGKSANAATAALAGMFVSTVTRRPATPRPVEHVYF